MLIDHLHQLGAIQWLFIPVGQNVVNTAQGWHHSELGASFFVEPFLHYLGVFQKYALFQRYHGSLLQFIALALSDPKTVQAPGCCLCATVIWLWLKIAMLL